MYTDQNKAIRFICDDPRKSVATVWRLREAVRKA